MEGKTRSVPNCIFPGKMQKLMENVSEVIASILQDFSFWCINMIKLPAGEVKIRLKFTMNNNFK